jgi:hypothetical protein
MFAAHHTLPMRSLRTIAFGMIGCRKLRYDGDRATGATRYQIPIRTNDPFPIPSVSRSAKRSCGATDRIELTCRETMTVHERRQELHQIKNAPDGPNKIFEIYNRLLARDGVVGTPGLMNNGQIEAILKMEFPEGEANRHD